MRASEGADAGKVDLGLLAAAFHFMEDAVGGENASLDAAANGDAFHLVAAEGRGDRARKLVIDADHGGGLRLKRGKDRGLDAGVVLERSVPVEMVGRDIEQGCRIGREAWGKLDLERR